MREGRRREFAAFAAAGAEVPDPQAEETFARSKLTRRGDPALRDLYARLLRIRRDLPAGAEVDGADCDPAVPWLRVRRGDFVLAANFGAADAALPAAGASEVVLSTHDARLEDGTVVLPARAGALLR